MKAIELIFIAVSAVFKFIVFIALIASFVLIALKVDFGSKTRFDRASWQSTDIYMRYIYVDDLIKRKILIGKTSSEAELLLGPPSSRSTSYLTYVTAKGSGFNVIDFIGISLTNEIVTKVTTGSD